MNTSELLDALNLVEVDNRGVGQLATVVYQLIKRVAALEADLRKASQAAERADSDSYARALSSGGGHGF